MAFASLSAGVAASAEVIASDEAAPPLVEADEVSSPMFKL